MRILFDQGVPAPLRRVLSGHEVSTAYERQWAELTNGLLLSRANREFDILITTDKVFPSSRTYLNCASRLSSCQRPIGHSFAKTWKRSLQQLTARDRER